MSILNVEAVGHHPAKARLDLPSFLISGKGKVRSAEGYEYLQLGYSVRVLELRSRKIAQLALDAVYAVKNKLLLVLASLKRYYSLLRSTGMDGMENLISAIHRSTFSICHSHSHHHYTTRMLEHCLGVYDEMVRMSKGSGFSQRDIILSSLLHDVGKGRSKEFSAYQGHHPERSMKIVRHYLKDVPAEVLNAIRYHQHHSPNHPLQNLMCDADHKDASTCNRASEFFKTL